jgi:hypothetical protein
MNRSSHLREPHEWRLQLNPGSKNRSPLVYILSHLFQYPLTPRRGDAKAKGNHRGWHSCPLAFARTVPKSDNGKVVWNREPRTCRCSFAPFVSSLSLWP